MDDNDEEKHKLARVLRFMADTMKYSNTMEDWGRVQTKTPWVEPRVKKKARKAGDHVTIATSAPGSQKVFKEFCYYLHENDGLNHAPKSFGTGDDFLTQVDQADQRLPPLRDLLDKLGEPYQSWEINEYAGGRVKILEYDYIQGKHWPSSTNTWIMVLKHVEIVHSLGFVHGDLLPRNLIFLDEYGYVIDFDLMRKENDRYVSGFNNTAFREYRHKKAKAGKKMKMKNDVWALACMTRTFFDTTAAAENCTTVSDLLALFINASVKPITAETVTSTLPSAPKEVTAPLRRSESSIQPC